MADLLHELPLRSAERRPEAPALTLLDRTIAYGDLASLIRRVARGLLDLRIGRGERVAFYLDKRFETVATAFGAACAGAAFVPINPLLKGEQVGHILRDCNVRVVVTNAERLDGIADTLAACPDLRHVVVVGPTDGVTIAGRTLVSWDAFVAHDGGAAHRVIDTDLTAIL